MTKALAMISGGLDSILAAKLIKDQGIEVIGICFKSHFFGPQNAYKMAEQIDIPIKVIDFSKDHLEMVKNPKHGYGKNMNPCIDCHAMMMNYCGSKLLSEFDADFIITGEVLNQRPMSQTKASLDIVKNESGFSEKILRPLCAKNLLPTEMEKSGMVDRERLLDISGRSRARQMELAKLFNINDYPSPAGGCKLTDPSFSNRLKELVKNNKGDICGREVELLKLGRHFRISENAKIISARTEVEVNSLKDLLNSNDIIFMAKDFNGSMTVIVGEPSEEEIEFAAKVTGRYSKGKDEENIIVKYGNFDEPLEKFIEIKPFSDDQLIKYLIK